MSDPQGMDISEQKDMWRHFARIMQIGVGATAACLILLAIFLL